MKSSQALMACLAGLAACASAAADPIAFTSIQFDTSAIALASDGPAGLDTNSGLLGTDLVSVSAASVGAQDVASAGALVTAELLQTSADVSASAVSNAVASTHFVGSFVNGAAVNLVLDFTTADAAAGSGAAASTLFVSLTSNGSTLFSNYVQGLWQFSYAAVAGSTSVLDLTLSSEVSGAWVTPGAGNASAFGLVTLASAVPEAASWLMFGCGLGLMAFVRLRTGARRAQAAPA